MTCWRIGQHGHAQPRQVYCKHSHADAPADPSNWGFPSSVVQTFGNDFLEDRALAAQAVGKPWVLEETGCNVGPAILLQNCDP